MRVVIVDRDHPDVFGALALLLHDAPDVQLIWDRRQQPDRRRPADARRTAGRRTGLPPAWSEMHWLAVDN